MENSIENSDSVGKSTNMVQLSSLTIVNPNPIPFFIYSHISGEKGLANEKSDQNKNSDLRAKNSTMRMVSFLQQDSLNFFHPDSDLAPLWDA